MKSTFAPAVPGQAPGLSLPRIKPRFYAWMAVLMTAIVLGGFWPSYYGPLLRGAASRPWVLHVHGAIFMGWMVLLMTQVALVVSGRTAAHRNVNRRVLSKHFVPRSCQAGDQRRCPFRWRPCPPPGARLKWRNTPLKREACPRHPASALALANVSAGYKSGPPVVLFTEPPPGVAHKNWHGLYPRVAP